jgi:hypothetical protein
MYKKSFFKKRGETKMGQYYNYVIEHPDRKTFFKKPITGFAKFTEQVEFDNPNLLCALSEIYNKPRRIAFTGDYFEDVLDEPKFKEKAKRYNFKSDNIYSEKTSQDELEYRKNIYSKLYSDFKPSEVVDFNHDAIRVFPKDMVLINYDKKEFIRLPDFDVIDNEVPKNGRYLVHPLPVLTAIGNGQGNGDYLTNNENHPHFKHVGSWALDIIEYAHTDKIPEGFENRTEDFQFRQDY